MCERACAHMYVCVPARAEKDTSWKVPVAACLCVSGGAATAKHDRLVAYKQQDYFSWLWRPQVQNQGASLCRSGGTLFLAHRQMPRLTLTG